MPKHDKSIKELREQVRALQRPAGQMNRAELIQFLETRGADGPKPEPAFIEKGEIKRLTRGRQEDKEIPQVEIYTEEKAPKVESKLAGITGKAVSARQRALEEEVRQKLSSRSAIQKAEMQILAAKLRKAAEREVETKKTSDMGTQAAPSTRAIPTQAGAETKEKGVQEKPKKGVEISTQAGLGELRSIDKMKEGREKYQKAIDQYRSEGLSMQEARIRYKADKANAKLEEETGKKKEKVYAKFEREGKLAAAKKIAKAVEKSGLAKPPKTDYEDDGGSGGGSARR